MAMDTRYWVGGSLSVLIPTGLLLWDTGPGNTPKLAWEIVLGVALTMGVTGLILCYCASRHPANHPIPEELKTIKDMRASHESDPLIAKTAATVV